MPFTDAEIAEHTALIEKNLWSRRRPPLHLRDQIREGQRLVGHTIELFYVRPAFRRPDHLVEQPFAKLQWVRARKVWKLFWQRADLKWHGYEPSPEAPTLTEALRIIDDDACHCFFG